MAGIGGQPENRQGHYLGCLYSAAEHHYWLESQGGGQECQLAECPGYLRGGQQLGQGLLLCLRRSVHRRRPSQPSSSPARRPSTAHPPGLPPSTRSSAQPAERRAPRLRLHGCWMSTCRGSRRLARCLTDCLMHRKAAPDAPGGAPMSLRQIPAHCRLMTGNGMNLAAVGSVLCFGPATIEFR